MITILLSLLVAAVTIFVARIDYKHYQNRLRAGMLLCSGALLIGFLSEPEWWPYADDQYLLYTGDLSKEEVSSTQPKYTFFLGEPDDQFAGTGTFLASAAFLTDKIPAGSRVSVHGEGTNEQLPEGFRWIDELTEPQQGILLKEAPSQIETGKQFKISGKLIGYRSGDSLDIIRDGLSLQTAQVDDQGQFEIIDLIRSAGPVQYQIEWTGTDTTIIEPWNIRAVEPERLRIGILVYSPSFEINYLTESFGGRGHSVAVRTRIGEERFRFDDLNDPPVASEELVYGTGEFDLLILDAREFVLLDRDQQNSIKEALEAGLDLLLLPPVDDETESWIDVINQLTGQQIGLTAISRLEERQWLPDGAESDRTVLNRIPLLDLNFENLPDRAVVVHQYEEEMPVAVRIPVGNGSVSTHLFHQTYRLLLRGEPELYNRLWADYFDRIITIESHFLEISETVTRVNRPVTMVTSHEEISVRTATGVDPVTLPVVFGVEHPASGYSVFWPGVTGWHQAEAGVFSKWFYMYGEEWEFSRRYRNYMDTSRQISEQQKMKSDMGLPQKTSVPGWVWLIGFLMIQAFLWIERKVA